MADAPITWWGGEEATFAVQRPNQNSDLPDLAPQVHDTSLGKAWKTAMATHSAETATEVSVSQKGVDLGYPDLP